MLCIIPTGNIRYLRMAIPSQDAPMKLQAEFKNYDGTELIWRDVPIIHTTPDNFARNEHKD